jgi:hypothetical protein
VARAAIQRGTGGKRTELEELRRTDFAVKVKVGGPVVLEPKHGARSRRPRRYSVSALEDGGDTVLLEPG